MSFEGDKARLVQELADMQALIRAEYGVAVSAEPAAEAKQAAVTPAKQATVTAI